MRRIISTLSLLIFVVAFIASAPVTNVTARPLMDTYTVQLDSSGSDTRINSSATTTNYGSITTLSTGKNNATGAVRRSFIYFDLSSIPSNATITSATLSLWIQQDLSNIARDVNVYRVTRNWVESQATWNIYSTGNNWQTAGADGASDYSSTVLATTNLANNLAVDAEVQWSLSTTEIKKFVDGTYSNYGLYLRASTENDDGYDYYSSDEVTKTTLRPKMVIVYTVPTSTPTYTVTSTFTLTPTATFTPTNTPTNTATYTPTNTPTNTATNTPGPTATYTDTPTNTATSTATHTATNTPTPTYTPTATATRGTPVMPTWYIEPQITYGEYMLNVALLGLCGVVLLAFFTIFVVILMRRKK